MLSPTSSSRLLACSQAAKEVKQAHHVRLQGLSGQLMAAKDELAQKDLQFKQHQQVRQPHHDMTSAVPETKN